LDELSRLLQLPVETTQLQVPLLLLNLALGAALGALMRAQYVRFARTLANRELFAGNFVPVILAVTLIISIVKASLALSLGLVGALSIVRFRTPIKEPEELVYLFLAIAVGLGLGAEQTLATVAAFAFIFALLTAMAWRRGGDARQALYLEVELSGSRPEGVLDALSGLLRRSLDGVNLRRFDSRGDALLASFSVSCADGAAVGRTSEAIRASWPDARITFLDQDHVPGV
jgi:hypothetical protein